MGGEVGRVVVGGKKMSTTTRETDAVVHHLS